MNLQELSDALNKLGIKHRPLNHVEGFYLDDHKVSLLLDRGLSQGASLAQAKPEAAVVLVRGEASLGWLLGLLRLQGELLQAKEDLLRREEHLMACLRDAPEAGFAPEGRAAPRKVLALPASRTAGVSPPPSQKPAGSSGFHLEN